jgi:hypothetical protein
LLLALDRAGLRVPEVLGTDAAGSRADRPAIVMSRLPGRPPTYGMTRRTGVLRQLVESLVRVHALEGPVRSLAVPYAPYHRLGHLRAPAATRRSLGGGIRGSGDAAGER